MATRANKAGQTMVEYIIVFAVLLGVVGALMCFVRAAKSSAARTTTFVCDMRIPMKRRQKMKSRKGKKGQTMVEYIIIVALVAISLIAVFTYFGRATGKKVAGAAAAISEEEGNKAQQAVESIDENTIKKLGE